MLTHDVNSMHSTQPPDEEDAGHQVGIPERDLQHILRQVIEFAEANTDWRATFKG
jgi:hypothetical protein